MLMTKSWKVLSIQRRTRELDDPEDRSNANGMKVNNTKCEI